MSTPKTTQLKNLLHSDDTEVILEAHNGLAARIVEEELRTLSRCPCEDCGCVRSENYWLGSHSPLTAPRWRCAAARWPSCPTTKHSVPRWLAS